MREIREIEIISISFLCVLVFGLGVNGDVKQQGTTSDMIFPIDYLISHISSFMTLSPGDIIMTGKIWFGLVIFMSFLILFINFIYFYKYRNTRGSWSNQVHQIIYTIIVLPFISLISSTSISYLPFIYLWDLFIPIWGRGGDVIEGRMGDLTKQTPDLRFDVVAWKPTEQQLHFFSSFLPLEDHFYKRSYLIIF